MPDYYYTVLRANLIGLEGEGIKEIAEAARIKDRNHFEALVPRIYELGGKLPEDMKAFHDMSACPPVRLPEDPTDIQAMLTVLVEAERCAVRGYSKICNMTAGKDHRTYALSLAILNEEIEHRCTPFYGEHIVSDPETRLQELVTRLRERRCRLTPQRLAVLKILAASEGHPSVERIHEQIAVDFPTTSLATVYKTVRLLKEMGEV